MIYTVRIEPHPDDEKRYADEQVYRRKQLYYAKWLNWISAAGAGIAFLALIALTWYACLTRESNKINKTAFDRAYRPYIGVNGVGVNYGYLTAPNVPAVYHGTARDTPTNLFSFSAEVKNFGPVPGTNFSNRWRVFISEVEEPQHKVPDTPFTLFPGQAVSLGGLIGTHNYPSIISGDKTLIVEVTTEYDGPSGHYKDCVKEQFSPRANSFLTLGACTH